jgi:hypothetical protein
VDWNEQLNVAKLIALARARPVLGRPTSSLDWRLLLQKVEQRRRVFSLRYMYRITLQNAFLWNIDKYVFHHPQYSSYVMCNFHCNFHRLWKIWSCALNITVWRTPNYNVPVWRSNALPNKIRICKFSIKHLSVILCFNLNLNLTWFFNKTVTQQLPSQWPSAATSLFFNQK